MIALRDGEALISYDDNPPETSNYSFKSGGKSASISESNSPRSDDVKGLKAIETGRDWPKFVSVAGDPKLVERVIVPQNLPANCGSAKAHRDQ